MPPTLIARADEVKNIPPGNYVYRSRWTGQCPKGQFPVAIPDMAFKLAS